MTPPLILAPMAGFSDSVFRLLCRRFGADAAVTEMISAKAMSFNDTKTKTLSALPKGDTPCAVQIFGHEPKVMAEAAKMLAEGSFDGCCYSERPAAIDINMGCPVKKIVTSGDGSALMHTPRLCGEIVKAVVRATEHTGIPVSVKIRAGWDNSSKNAVDVAKICADAGASAVCVHARTREQMYSPGIDIDIIKNVRKSLDASVKVIGNGDIATADDAMLMLERTECDGLMIGRAALGAPWLFGMIKSAMNGETVAEPSNSEKIKIAREFVCELVELKGEEVGVREARGRAAHFIKGMRGSAEVRDKLNRAATLKEFDMAMAELYCRQ